MSWRVDEVVERRPYNNLELQRQSSFAERHNALRANSLKNIQRVMIIDEGEMPIIDAEGNLVAGPKWV